MIVGVDVSSKRIDLAWLEDGKPQRWHQELAKGVLIDRLRSVRIQWPAPTHPLGAHIAPGASITDIAIEYPFARQHTAIAALMSTVGIITRQAPPWTRVAWPSSGDLRAAIGAKNTKADAHHAIHWAFSNGIHASTVEDWDEHSLDALVTCIGWTKILAAQDAA